MSAGRRKRSRKRERKSKRKRKNKSMLRKKIKLISPPPVNQALFAECL